MLANLGDVCRWTSLVLATSVINPALGQVPIVGEPPWPAVEPAPVVAIHRDTSPFWDPHVVPAFIPEDASEYYLTSCQSAFDSANSSFSNPSGIRLVQGIAPVVPPAQPPEAGGGSPFDYVSPDDFVPRLARRGVSVGEADRREAEPSETEAPGLASRSDIAPPNPLPSALSSTPAVNVTTGAEAAVLGVTDTAHLLAESNSVQTVEVRRRSPIDLDPHVRGYHIGQIYSQADGALWFPVRQDLDTILSKIDPSLVQDVIVVPGPYGLRYGPGLVFLDVMTTRTPRYDTPEIHHRAGLTTRTNGGQVYGRETIFGGGPDWGMVFDYGNRAGSDYEAGNGRKIPSSYDAVNFTGQLGIDIGEYSQLEFRATRLDQSDTEYAAQFFDIDSLVTDAISLTYSVENPCALWDRFSVDGWHNRTEFLGDTRNASKRNFNVINRVEAALGGRPFEGDTNGGLTSSGARGVWHFGEADTRQLSLGTDFRYLKQALTEDFVVFGAPQTEFTTNMPRARSFDPGLFAEWTVPFDEFWTSSVGGRVDWAHTSALVQDVRSNTSLPNGTSDLEQNDVLYAFYLTHDLQLTDKWDARLGFGHAQRNPTLIERYADGLFLGIIQSGFSRVIGTPSLRKERAWQVDVSLNGEVAGWRTRSSVFHSWILDYITFTGNQITDPTGARLLRTINTEYATLAGFEVYGDRELTSRWTVFGSLHYVEGRDQQIDRPVASIPPLEGQAGLRFFDVTGGETWGTEFAARVVDNQDRLGALRIGTTSVIDIIDLEEPTPGFMVFNLRGYWNVTKQLHVVAGIDNLFDRNYLEHLNLRLPDVLQFAGTQVLEPGITPFVNVEWTR